MNSPIEIRKVIWGIVLTLLWVCIFVFFNPNLYIDWTGQKILAQMTPLKPIVIICGLVVLVLYHILNKAHPETNKLSLTAALTICWVSLIIFFKFGHSGTAGAVGFFTLIGGLAVVVLWVRFLSDEILA